MCIRVRGVCQFSLFIVNTKSACKCQRHNNRLQTQVVRTCPMYAVWRIVSPILPNVSWNCCQGPLWKFRCKLSWPAMNHQICCWSELWPEHLWQWRRISLAHDVMTPTCAVKGAITSRRLRLNAAGLQRLRCFCIQICSLFIVILMIGSVAVAPSATQSCSFHRALEVGS